MRMMRTARATSTKRSNTRRSNGNANMMPRVASSSRYVTETPFSDETPEEETCRAGISTVGTDEHALDCSLCRGPQLVLTL